MVSYLTLLTLHKDVAMKSQIFINKLLTGVLAFLMMAVVYAGTPLWTLTNSNALGSNGLATGVSPGSVTITATMGTVSGSTELTITSPRTTTLNISPSQLALSVTGLIEYGVRSPSGVARTITITNEGPVPALTLAVTLPVWPSGTIADTTNCQGITLGVGESCTITVTPGDTATSDSSSNPCSAQVSNHVPVPGVVQVTSSNANDVSTHVVVLNYGCIYQRGYIYAFDDTTPNTGSVGGKVAATSDQAPPSPNGVIWSSNGSGSNVAYNVIYGISRTSTTALANPGAGYVGGQSACNGATDGACNTNNIYIYYQSYATGHPINLSYYAAGLCKQLSVDGYSNWYLPAICEMGYYMATGCGSSGTPTLQNMQSNLVNLNGLNLLSGSYWSSTEDSSSPLNYGWGEFFASGDGSVLNKYKSNQLGVRCSRALSV